MRSEEFGAYISSAALYRVESIEDPPLQNVPHRLVPPALVRNCEECGLDRSWAWQNPHPECPGIFEGRSVLTYRCRNCGKGELSVWLRWGEEGATVRVVKLGQEPKLEVSVPKEFGEALGGDLLRLYRKGMTSRHAGYGLGALVYFRRLIEETTTDMLDRLEEAMMEIGADAAKVAELQEAKQGKGFEDKVRIAAKVLPDHLRPGGINPFGDLYSLLSIGIHGLTDEQCCDVVDAIDRSLKFIYTQIKAHVEDAKTYKEAAREINAMVSRMRSTGSREKGGS